MDFKKKLILFSVFALLGFQFLVIISPYRFSNRLTWPFLNYPMYAGIRHPGDEITFRDLYISDSEGDSIKVNYKDLRLMNRRLKVTLRGVEQYMLNKSDDSLHFNYLNYLLRKNFDREFINAQIIIKTYRMSDAGFDQPDSSKVHVYKWAIE